VEQWLAWKEPSVKETSLAEDRSVLQLIVDYYGDIPVHEIGDLSEWIHAPIQIGKSGEYKERADITKRRYAGRISNFFRWCVDNKITFDDPTSRLKIRKEPESFPRFLMPDEVDRYVATVLNEAPKDHQWVATVVRSNVHLAARRNEVRWLRWGNVMFARNRNDITLLKIGHVGRVTTKSYRERIIPVAAVAEEELRKLHAQRTDIYDHNEFVFKDDRGQLTGDHITKTFAKYRKAAGLPDEIDFQTTRHTAISWLAMEGVPVNAIKEFAGHSRLRTTERYMHLAPRVYHRQILDAFNLKRELMGTAQPLAA
jgi:integrase